MRLVAVGRAGELTGFALAGVEIASCDSPADADPLVAGLTDAGAAVGIVIVSPWIGRHAARSISAARRRRGPPVIVVVPDPPSTGD